MAGDSTAAATKQDVGLLMGEMGKLYEEIQKLYAANEEWKDEIIQHFDVVVEDLRHDVMGANRDEVVQLQHRVTRLEKHTGIAA